MKNKLLGLFVMLLFGVIASNLNAQSPTYLKDWTALEESPKLIDVSYCVLKCTDDSDAEIHLNVFNENPTEQSVSFKLWIADSQNGNSIEFNVSDLVLTGGEMKKPQCGSNANSEVRFTVPANIDPAHLAAKIEYKN